MTTTDQLLSEASGEVFEKKEVSVWGGWAPELTAKCRDANCCLRARVRCNWSARQRLEPLTHRLCLPPLNQTICRTSSARGDGASAWIVSECMFKYSERQTRSRQAFIESYTLKCAWDVPWFQITPILSANIKAVSKHTRESKSSAFGTFYTLW